MLFLAFLYKGTLMLRQSGLRTGRRTEWNVFSFVRRPFLVPVCFLLSLPVHGNHTSPTPYILSQRQEKKMAALNSVSSVSILGCSLDLNKTEVTVDFKSQYIMCT